MGKTVASYHLALEDEIHRRKSFEKALRTEDRETSEALIDACRSYASTGSNVTQPILFETMVISILLSQQKKIMCLEKALDVAERFKPIKGCLFDVYTSEAS
jgi:hypothetical protein